MIAVTVNGEPRQVPPGATIAHAVGYITSQQAGVAAALNGEVVPRRAWPATTLADGDQVEVVTAVQGG